MLRILKVLHDYKNEFPLSGNQLFNENKRFNFIIEAPIFWWVDVSMLTYGFELGEFSETERKTMSISTNIRACLSLTYQEIVEICEDYVQGGYKFNNEPYKWSNEREWNDLCETLLDIKGVRDIVKEETV